MIGLNLTYKIQQLLVQAVIGLKVCLTTDIERPFLGAHSLGLGLSLFKGENLEVV